MPISTKQFLYEIKTPLMLRGDVFIHFFQVHNRTRQTELISSVQFHTCAIERNELEFAKCDISFPQSGELLILIIFSNLFFHFISFCRFVNESNKFFNCFICKFTHNK